MNYQNDHYWKTSGLIVVISDIHLGWKGKSNVEGFNRFIENFLETHSVQHLVLLGDIMEFWTRSPHKVLIENKTTLKRLTNLDAKLHYIIGNHDYIIRELFIKTHPEIFNFSDNIVLESGNQRFRFLHGHQIFEEIIFGSFFYHGLCLALCQHQNPLKLIYQLLRQGVPKNPLEFLRKSPDIRLSGKDDGLMIRNLRRKKSLDWFHGWATETALEWARRIALEEKDLTKLEEEDFLIFGHFHKPGINHQEKWANSGCWIKNEPQMTTAGFTDYAYLLIEKGEIELHPQRIRY